MDAKTTHPLILVAAGAVTIASLAAAAHFTGLLPAKTEITPPATVAAAAPVAPVVSAPVAAPPVAASAPAPQAAPVRKAAVHRTPAPVREAQASDPYQRRVSTTPRDSDNGIDVYPGRQTANNGAPSVQMPPAPPVCRDCGTVENVREIAVKGEGSGIGAVAGGVLGGLLGNQTGRGKGKDVMTVLGAVGGAFGGHQVEKMVRTEKQYEVTVRFDDGTVRTYSQASTTWHPGDRVRSYNGSLNAL